MRSTKLRPRPDRDDMRPNETIVRPATIRRYATSAGGGLRFGIVRSDSTDGIISTYLVDVYGATVASLEESATSEAQDALQSPASVAFYRGEVVALRRVDGVWLISKLFGTSLSNLVEAGDLGCRALLRSALLTDLAWDYAGIRDALGSFAAIDVIGVVASTWWGYGYFPRTDLVPIVVPAALASRVATIDTVSEAAGVASTINYPTRFSLSPAAVRVSLTWYWNQAGTSDPSMTVEVTSGAESARSLTAIAFGAGASAVCPSPTLGAHPATATASFDSGSLTYSTSTTIAVAAAGAEVVPDEGVRVNRGALVSVAAAGNFSGGNDWWRYNTAGNTTETPTYSEFLPASGVAPASAATTVGTGTVSLI